MGDLKWKVVFLSGLAMLLSITPVNFVLADTPQNSVSQLQLIEQAFIKVAENVKPAVVNISTVYKIKHPRGGMKKDYFYDGPFKDFFDEDFFERFFKDIPHGDIPQKSLGSGIIISNDGYILTNNHVIEKAEKIEVRLSDKKNFIGEIIGIDPKTDVAVVKIDPKDHHLVSAKLGDSDACMVGQWAIAVGNPFGLDRTVTVGVISATGRSDIGIAAYENFIQTDASINHGNSGGPLVNVNGEVIGINTAIVAAGQGIGFAIPINMARNVMEQLIEHGEVIRGWMGIAIQNITEELGKQFGVEAGSGVLVGQVFKDDPADKAGIKIGDIITKFDGQPVNDPSQLSRLAAATLPEKKVGVEIIRDGKVKKLSIVMGKQKEENPVQEVKTDIYGMEIQELTPALANKLGLAEDGAGVLVSKVEPGGPASQAGIKTGDLIVEVNRQKVSNLDEYNNLISALKPGESIMVLRTRDNNSLYVVITPAEEEPQESDE
jgi:serine protease Do